MAHLAGQDCTQLLLLPEAVDDEVVPENSVRFIEAFVDELDLGAAGFTRVVPKAIGRPGCDPADLLKLTIYGDLNRVRSSRRLEGETHRNIEVIWLLRGLKPDLKPIANFRRDTRAAFRSVFRAFVVLSRQLDLFGRELPSIGLVLALFFHYSRFMESLDAIAALSALAQPTRLECFRVLVRHEPGGLPAGELARTLGVPANTLSAHLAILSHAGLVAGEREGRSVVYRASLERVRALTLFLLKDCCEGRAELCEPILAELAPCC